MFREGFLVIGEAAGFSINHGYTARGIDLAMLSGVAAAKAILSVEDSSGVGPAYLRELDTVGLMSAMKTTERLDDVLEIHRLYKTYPKLISDLLDNLYRIDKPVPANILTIIKKSIKDNGVSILQLLKDGFRGYRSL
jgi:electron transfer flavoprotein-quinone oxidoreductase